MHTSGQYLHCNSIKVLTLSRRRPLSYRNQSIDLLCKSMDWFLYDNGLRHGRVKENTPFLKMEKLGYSCYCLS